jgi:hypothetical protein
MPGIIGAVGLEFEVCSRLRREFEQPWESSECIEVSSGILGGHAFPPHTALYEGPTGIAFAVDGEDALYQAAEEHSAAGSALFGLKSDELILSPSCKGNIVVADRNSGLWFLAAEWSGAFPLYYLATHSACARLGA